MGKRPEPTTKLIEDRYLGDGVYASFDGYHIVLDLRAQDSTTRIALEPAVLASLNSFQTAVEAAVECEERNATQN